jgi:hypothetical protein
MSESNKGAVLQQFVVEYLPRDAVRVLEDIRLSDPDYLRGSSVEVGNDVTCMLAAL